MVSHETLSEAHHVLRAGDSVIALYFSGRPGDDYEHSIFGPATVLEATYATPSAELAVEFWDGKRDRVQRSQCFWISSSYYDTACAYIQQRLEDK